MYVRMLELHVSTCIFIMTLDACVDVECQLAAKFNSEPLQGHYALITLLVSIISTATNISLCV